MIGQDLKESLIFIGTAKVAEPFRALLLKMREDGRDRLETLRGDNILVEQGRAQVLKEIIEKIEGAQKDPRKT